MAVDHEIRFLPQQLYPMQSHHMLEIERNLALHSPVGNTRLRAALQGVLPVFLCFTNRTGSNLLTDILDQAHFGVRVAEEDFNSATVLAASKAHGLTSFSEYLAHMVNQTVKNGTCVLKIGAAQLLWLANRGFIPDFMEGAKYLFAHRKDKIAQAVSLYIKNQTGQYLAHMTPTGKSPVFDKRRIAEQLMWILENEKIFKFYFELHGILALDLWYEEIVASPRLTILRVAKYCGLDQCQWVKPGDVDLGNARVRRQGTDLNASFCAAMRREFAIDTTG